MDRIMDSAGEAARTKKSACHFSTRARTAPPLDAIGTRQHGQPDMTVVPGLLQDLDEELDRAPLLVTAFATWEATVRVRLPP
jgi:hypothetical protein